MLELDLRVMPTLWTSGGARDVFAELINQCVLAIYGNCKSIKPNPGDDGIDTFAGEFESDLHVWQSKYFVDAVDQGQVRKSWKSVTTSTNFACPKKWTLCIPHEMTVKETAWWETWKKKNSEDFNCSIDLWTKTNFVKFSFRPDLKQIFRHALRLDQQHTSAEDAIKAMQDARANFIKELPPDKSFTDAVFIKKLEKADITQHRAIRTAFYNFELWRQRIEQENDPTKLAALLDLQEKIYALWESAFNAHSPDNLGRDLFLEVDKLMEKEEQNQLFTPLQAHLIHKKGALHYWADLCEIGWTADFKTIGMEDSDEKTANPLI